MSDFTPDWLDVREPADHAARSRPAPLALAETFAKMVRERARGPVRLVDLAGGTGNNVRFLAPVIRGKQRWTVWDTDPSLLARVQDSCRLWAGTRGWNTDYLGDRLVVDAPEFSLSIAGVRNDLREHLDLGGFDGVTCAALLDLVSAPWCENLVEAVERAGHPPLLCSLVADGGWSWTPALPDDGSVGEIFGQDMKKDKGFGPSLGYRAALVAAEALRSRGMSVDEVASPWHIESAAINLQAYLLDFHAAVIEARGTAATERWQDWLMSRRAMLGRQKLRVGHREILASR